jgi:hypothetical protein
LAREKFDGLIERRGHEDATKAGYGIDGKFLTTAREYETKFGREMSVSINFAQIDFISFIPKFFQMFDETIGEETLYILKKDCFAIRESIRTSVQKTTAYFYSDELPYDWYERG